MRKSDTAARPGDTVTIHFTAVLDDGTEIETTSGSAPLTFVVGSGAVVAGLDEEMRQMKAGDKRIAVLKPEDAFGPRREDLIRRAPLAMFPKDLDVTPGKRIGAKDPEGELHEMNVLAIEGDEAVLDANHPFAGLEITYRIEMISVKTG